MCLLVIGCCVPKEMFYVNHTAIKANELPEDCQEELIRNINTAWLKFGNIECYYLNVFPLSIAMENKDCFVGMDLKLVKDLLGKPTKEDTNALVYELDLDCTKNQTFKSLVFYLSKGKVNDVHFGTNSSKN